MDSINDNVKLQKQIRDESDHIKDTFTDFYNWQNDIKLQELKLKSEKCNIEVRND